jgi:hypothetical protein
MKCEHSSKSMIATLMTDIWPPLFEKINLVLCPEVEKGHQYVNIWWNFKNMQWLLENTVFLLERRNENGGEEGKSDSKNIPTGFVLFFFVLLLWVAKAMAVPYDNILACFYF